MSRPSRPVVLTEIEASMVLSADDSIGWGAVAKSGYLSMRKDSDLTRRWMKDDSLGTSTADLAKCIRVRPAKRRGG